MNAETPRSYFNGKNHSGKKYIPYVMPQFSEFFRHQLILFCGKNNISPNKSAFFAAKYYFYAEFQNQKSKRILLWEERLSFAKKEK
jgi:hypothetical protein